MAGEEQQKHRKQGKIIAVCSAKGGIGKTLLSVNLSVALSKKNLDVTIVDGDFQFGDVCLAMDLQPTFTMKDVMDEVDGLNEYTIMNYVTRHSSSVQVLAAPERPELADLITSDGIVKGLETLVLSNDYVVVDTGSGIQGHSLEILEKADEILVITNLEMTALKNTKLILETFRQIGMGEKVQLIVNRYNMESLMKAEDIPSMLGAENPMYIPNNFKLASQSMNLGIPLVISQAKSDVSKAIFKMAEQIISKRIVKEDGKKRKKSFIHKILPTH
ncbi:AAA family ATPase [Evansella sp. AB-P1]|uniref:AAA family ATPase n=1 Tax=Evansella sp. AB-P1 TaxID=3037653 RepID=UPI00241EE5EA|nr:AAA family ATPase [Evansella sp. AB-P1]MDG5790061.1 AAA family ATPase [Evansella sp. AB-P1]